MLVFALALPVLVALESGMAILFIGLALWEAWKINKRRPPAVDGPHPLVSSETP